MSSYSFTRRYKEARICWKMLSVATVSRLRLARDAVSMRKIFFFSRVRYIYGQSFFFGGGGHVWRMEGSSIESGEDIAIVK